MKKLFLSAIFVLCSTMAMNANNILGFFNVGARIGIISSSEQIPTTGEDIKQSITAEGTGWTGTVFARINIPALPIFIQPELQYTNTTIDLPSLSDIIPGEDEAKPESHKYIDMPVLVGFEFGLGSLASVRINAGPVFAIASEKGFLDLLEEDFVAAYKDPTVSWTAGIGAKILGFTADFRYNGNFTDGRIDTQNIAGSIDTSRTSWSISVGLMF